MALTSRASPGLSSTIRTLTIEEVFMDRLLY